MPQPTSSGEGGLYLESYEVSFPLEESIERPPAYHLNQGQPMMDGPVVHEPPHSLYSPFILISNLRAHLYVTLEKNAWLQKRIEDMEEERNFLRCQLDRFIINMRGPEDWCVDPQRGVKVQHASPPTPPSPMTTRSGMTLKRQQGAAPRPRRASAFPVRHYCTLSMKQEFHLDEDKFYTEDEFVEEEEEEEEEEDSSILTTYQRVRSMSRAFQVHGVDRNTMASTSPIAELLLVAPEKVAEVGEFEASKEKLLDYARRCYKTMDEQTHVKVQAMKKTHKLLPISYRFRN
ncbi:hypothetical protein F7725_025387 [Dissostichus mawsoni]|uniref:Coiled-coil domain containing 106 n=1 Tax=Dissostichus mawsoni TaxID=36200 RepID=A0A7J5XBF6_DISMA|nr:hypothetical protein F7725_025387 [Dissostichus mawsoni]